MPGDVIEMLDNVLVDGNDKSVRAYRNRWTWDKVSWSSHCGNCIANCSYRLYSLGGETVVDEQSGVLPCIEGIPDMNPLGCQKGSAWQTQIRESDRITTPLRRVGERGSGQWEEVSWDEALTTVADAIVTALDTQGSESIVFDHGAEAGVLASMAKTKLGLSLDCVSLDGNATVSDVHMGHWATFGNLLGGSSADDTFRAQVIITWNGNPAFTRIPYFHYLTEARYRGAKIVHIGPDYSPSAIHADLFIPIRPGTDAAFALAVSQVLIQEQLADLDFVRSQTDLPLLVKISDGRFLREADLVEGGREDRFYAWKEGAPEQVDVGKLDPPSKPTPWELHGIHEVSLANGEQCRVTTVFEQLCSRLEEYSPEKVTKICGVNPETIREFAHLVATSRTKLQNGLGSCKHYHGDLMERSMDLILALTGNWGKPGTGFDTYTIALLDGEVITMFKRNMGAQASEEAINAMDSFLDLLMKADPTMAQGKAFLQLMRVSAAGTGSTPPAFFYYYHCGFDEVWSRAGYGDSPRPISNYIEEATSKGWWSGLVRPDPSIAPRIFIQAGTNAMRKIRGGQRMMLDSFWPGLDLAVSVDWRLNTAAMFCDIFLPVACEGERVELHGANSHSFERAFSDKVREPAGNSLPEWEVFAKLAKRVVERAKSRGLERFKDGHGVMRSFCDVDAPFESRGELLDPESVLDEVLRDSALSGNLPAGTSLNSVRESGWLRPIQLPRPMSSVCGADISESEPVVAYRNHIEDGVPFETLTGRAQFYIDHPWFIEADEQLACHKETPMMGGNYPLELTGGHPRWSIHATNTTSRLMLETTRGHPVVHMNPIDAKNRNVVDDMVVEVFNDLGSLRVCAKISPSVRPGQVILYASWEQYLYPEWKDVTWVEPGVVKWLHFAGNYGHLGYSPMQWQPTQSDRVYRIDVRASSEIPS